MIGQSPLTGPLFSPTSAISKAPGTTLTPAGGIQLLMLSQLFGLGARIGSTDPIMGASVRRRREKPRGDQRQGDLGIKPFDQFEVTYARYFATDEPSKFAINHNGFNAFSFPFMDKLVTV